MFNPLAQIKLLAEELRKSSDTDPNKLSIVEALLVKFFFAFVVVFCLYVYLDKTSVLNGNTPEENQRLYKINYKEKENEKDDDRDEEVNEGVRSVSSGTSVGQAAKSRKT